MEKLINKGGKTYETVWGTYKKDTGELIIRNPKEAAKDSLGRILVDLKNKQQALKKERQALEELHLCLPIGS